MIGPSNRDIRFNETTTIDYWKTEDNKTTKQLQVPNKIQKYTDEILTGIIQKIMIMMIMIVITNLKICMLKMNMLIKI